MNNEKKEEGVYVGVKKKEEGVQKERSKNDCEKWNEERRRREGDSVDGVY